MTENLPARLDPDLPLFVVSVAAQLAGMHPQTLRGYDRLGLVVPRRAKGRGRRYSLRDVAKLRHIQQLSQDEGINLEGIRRILALESELDTLRTQVAQLGDMINAIQNSSQDPRVFTATQFGDIHLGRTARLRIQRAITG
ncbi:MAG: helix-turn-helix transcriptional regulator [Propionibacteriaceae bacterium]|jgi:MerR family transcriptional regulator/heat shock protein HspR|nr:helix-turn-helix transcriptional regulator [Propionibacteriaceae bacterium]